MIKKALTMIQAECLPFGCHSNYIDAYTSFYTLHVNECEYEYGYVKTKEFRLFVQRFRPNTPIGTVLLIHGYLDHAGSLNRIIHILVENQFQVICYDLPGHGLSTGERATIKRFEDYTETLQFIYDNVLLKFTDHPILVAHSTGAIIGLEFAKQKKGCFAKMVFIAPLFRPHLWNVSKVGLFLSKPFTKKLTRVFKMNSSDKDYLSFTKKDPLQEKKLPVSWLHTLNSWLRNSKPERREDISFLMIQGDRDKTIDTTYGLKSVADLYPKSKVILINNGHHQLLNEGKAIREQTFFILLKYIKGGIMNNS